MKKTTEQAITAVLNSDQTVTPLQAESAIAAAHGKHGPQQPLLLRQRDVAELCGVSRQTIWTLVKQGKLRPVYITDGLVRYRRIDVMALIERGAR